MHLDYAHRAQQHRPTDEATLRAAAFELQQRGLTPRDIAASFGLTTQAIEQLLGSDA